MPPTLLVGTLSALALGLPALAQPSTPRDSAPAATVPAPDPALAPEPVPGLTLVLTPRVEHDLESNLQDGDGRSGVTRAGGSASLLYPVDEQLRVAFTVDGEQSWYTFRGRDQAGRNLDDRLDTAYSISLVPSLQYAFDRQWAVVAGGFIELEAENDADVGRAFTYGGFGGVRYSFTDAFAVTLGAGAKTRLEDDPTFIPIIGLEWKASERVKLSTERLGLKVSIKVTEQVNAWLSGGYESREYRLADDHDLTPEGVGRDQRVPIRFGIDFSPSKRLTLEAYTGVIVWQEYQFLDRDGRQVFEDHSNPAAIVGLRASFVF